MNSTVRRAGALALTWTLAYTITAQSSGLNLNLAKPLGGSSPREVYLRVVDGNGRAAAGATVTVRLPQSAISPSGLRTEVLSAGPDGLAPIRGLRWPGPPGRASLEVTATLRGARADLSIPVEVIAQVPEPREASGKHSKAWLWMILAAGGAAAGAMAFAGGSSPTTTAPTVMPVITPPAVGAPTITISKP
jgi:hypothetical protein